MVTTKELVPVCHVVTHAVHTPDVHNDTYHNTTRDNTNPHVPQQHTITQAHTVYTMSRTTCLPKQDRGTDERVTQRVQETGANTHNRIMRKQTLSHTERSAIVECVPHVQYR